jgi:Ca-activated chloride channel family protein
MYGCAIRALDILDKVTNDYTKTVILMTDGEANVGTYKELAQRYQSLSSPIPIYSIMFGSASSDQLSSIASLTNAKVFDGRSNLIEAFKTVRSYN